MLTLHREFKDLLDEGVSETAAAILVLAGTIQGAIPDTLSHELCMGIRKGLFGAHASEEASLHVGDSLEYSLTPLSNAVEHVAQAISEHG